MEREMFDVVFGVVGGIVGFEGHAVVAHSVGSVFAELGITTARDLAILRAPVAVDCIFFYVLPWTRGGDLDAFRLGRRLCVGYNVSGLLRRASGGSLLVGDENEISMPN